MAGHTNQGLVGVDFKSDIKNNIWPPGSWPPVFKYEEPQSAIRFFYFWLKKGHFYSKIAFF